VKAIFRQTLSRSDNLEAQSLTVTIFNDGAVDIASKLGDMPEASFCLLTGELEVLRTMLRYAAMIEIPSRFDPNEGEE
jgi:hypothetical protein